jgi:hypothetical protein
MLSKLNLFFALGFLSLLGLILPPFARAGTITFDECPATNNNTAFTGACGVPGVTFGPTNSGTWGGNSNGDPGNWDLEGTNGPQFLGFNGVNSSSTDYNETVSFGAAVSSVALDFSRANGSSDGTITLSAFDGALLLGSTTAALGPINSWTTLTLSFPTITSITWDGTGSGFHPYGVDNFRFVPISAAEPSGILLLSINLLGAVLIGLSWKLRKSRLSSLRAKIA